MSDTFDSAWAALADDNAAHGMIQRRVLPDSPHDCYLIESRPSGDLRLRLVLKDQSRPPTVPIPGTKGMVCTTSVTEQGFIVDLSLASRDHEQLFRTLVDEVLGLVATSPGASCATEVLSYVRACLGFWSRHGSALSKEAAAGLYAELHVLQKELIPALGGASALQRWTGPKGSTHDFQFARGAIEVKSWRGLGAPAPTISSELQLSIPEGGKLLLHVVSLDQREEGPGETIAAKVDAVLGLFPHAADRSHFRSLLIEAGWSLSAERIRTEKYSVIGETTLTVTDDFPRLTPQTLPKAIRRVSYVLDTAGLDDYRLDSLTLEGLEA